MTTYIATWEYNIAEFLTYHCSSHNQASRPAVCTPCSVDAFVNGLPAVDMVGDICADCGGDGSPDYNGPDPEGQPTDMDFLISMDSFLS